MSTELTKEQKALHIAGVISRFSSKSKIEKIAEVVYPIENERDIDGDYFDTNRNKREGFTTGCLVLLQECGVDLNGL